MTTLSELPKGSVAGRALPHESAALHVTGRALYTDALLGRTPHVLHAHPVQSPHAHAKVTDLRTAGAYDEPGVVRVLTADDVPDYVERLGRRYLEQRTDPDESFAAWARRADEEALR